MAAATALVASLKGWRSWAQSSLATRQDQFRVLDLRFDCLIDYERPISEENHIEGSFKLVCGFDNSIPGAFITASDITSITSRIPIVVYLCSGPDVANDPLKIPELNRFWLRKGFWILYPDYRGTGDSASSLISPGSVTTPRFKMLIERLRRVDIVRDLESVRRNLVGESGKWTLLGQSYGTWIALTYLSFHPKGLQEVFLSGGLPPIRRGPKEFYERLFQRLVGRNELCYRKFPGDVNMVKQVVYWLSQQKEGIPLPDGGKLTAQRFLCVGRILGTEAGFQKLHNLLIKIWQELRHKTLTQATLKEYGELDRWRFADRPLFALLYEANFCHSKGMASRMAAMNVAKSIPSDEPDDALPNDLTAPTEISVSLADRPFSWVDPPTTWANDPRAFLEYSIPLLTQENKLYFSGTMIYPFMYDDDANLEAYKSVAAGLAQKQWAEDMYDLEQLKRNDVKIHMVVDGEGMNVVPEFTRETLNAIHGPGRYDYVVQTDAEPRGLGEDPAAGLTQLWDSHAQLLEEADVML